MCPAGRLILKISIFLIIFVEITQNCSHYIIWKKLSASDNMNHYRFIAYMVHKMRLSCPLLISSKLISHLQSLKPICPTSSSSKQPSILLHICICSRGRVINTSSPKIHTCDTGKCRKKKPKNIILHFPKKMIDFSIISLDM